MPHFAAVSAIFKKKAGYAFRALIRFLVHGYPGKLQRSDQGHHSRICAAGHNVVYPKRTYQGKRFFYDPRPERVDRENSIGKSFGQFLKNGFQSFPFF